MDKYIKYGNLSNNELKKVRKTLKQLRLRRHYKKATVYQRDLGNSIESRRRRSKRISFDHPLLSNCIEKIIKKIDTSIFISKNHHIELIKYGSGDYFQPQYDYKETFINGAFQVSIIIGLVDTQGGATKITIEDESKIYNQSITKGGILILNSNLLHECLSVVGEKEILLLTGYSFLNKKLSQPVYNPFIHHLDFISVIVSQSHYDNDDDEPHDNKTFLLYIYYLGKLVGFYTNCKCWGRNTINFDTVTDFKQESVSVIDKIKHLQRSMNCDVEYPILETFINEHNITDLVKTMSYDISDNYTQYRYEKEWCNGYDGYDYVKVPNYTEYICSKHFKLTCYGNDYYKYWCRKLGFDDNIYMIMDTFLTW